MWYTDWWNKGARAAQDDMEKIGAECLLCVEAHYSRPQNIYSILAAIFATDLYNLKTF